MLQQTPTNQQTIVEYRSDPRVGFTTVTIYGPTVESVQKEIDRAVRIIDRDGGLANFKGPRRCLGGYGAVGEIVTEDQIPAARGIANALGITGTVAILIGAAFILSACATAGGSWAQSCIPPKQFDYEPKHYYVRNLSPANLRAVCGSTAALGCSIGRTIYVRKDLNKQWRACVLRHEKAHINGAAGDHRT